MKRVIAMAAAALTALAQAAEYHLIKGKTDWQSPESYVETAGTSTLPPAGSDLFIPTNGAMSVSTASDFTFVNSMAAIRPLKNSVLTVDVPTGSNDLACAVYVSRDASVWDVGTFKKTGAGTLTLSSRAIDGTWGECSDYFLHLDVEDGTLSIYPGKNMGNKLVLVRNVSVGSSGILEIPGYARFSMFQLNGSGLVTNANASVSASTLIFPTTSPGGVFSGKLAGPMSVYVQGRQFFLGTESHFSSGYVWVYGYAGSIGKGYCGFGALAGKTTADPTSLGHNYFNLGDSGNAAYLKYFGTGETVSKVFYLKGYNAKGPYVFDAGGHGGWKFSGSSIINLAMGHLQIVLAGSNTVSESVMSTGDLKAQSDGYVEQLIKRGPGIWKLAESGSASGLGLVTVEEGTLRYDTLRAKGTHCALGLSETLFDGLVGATDETKRVPYAIRLGGGSTNAVFEYTGSAFTKVSDRAIALSPGVSHVRNSGEGVLRLAHAGGVASGAKTLVLDGDNAGENVFSTISNGVGTVSVVKDGTGTWSLAGEQSFSGTLSVKAGTLNLINPATYTFYKWIFKETLWNAARYADLIAARGASSGVKSELRLAELALYDADGNRQNLGLTVASSMSTLTPGQTAYDQDTLPTPTVATKTWYASPFDLFDGYSYHREDSKYVENTEYCVKNVGTKGFSLADSTSWISIACRLTNSAPAVAYYDLAYQYGTNAESWACCSCLSAFSIQASVDGINWDEVATQNAADIPAENQRWLSDKSAYWGKANRKVTGSGDCFALRGAPETAVPFLSSISGFSIARGATVRALGRPVTLPSGVTVSVDASGEGTAAMEGVTLPATGALVVTGAPARGDFTLPLTVSDASVANLENWPVSVNGKTRSTYAVSVEDRVITIKRSSGLMLIFR